MRIFKEVIANEAFDAPITVHGNRIIHAGIQGDVACIWFEVNPDRPALSFEYRVVGTGWEYDSEYDHVATYMDGPFVWHVLEKIHYNY